MLNEFQYDFIGMFTCALACTSVTANSLRDTIEDGCQGHRMAIAQAEEIALGKTCWHMERPECYSTLGLKKAASGTVSVIAY